MLTDVLANEPSDTAAQTELDAAAADIRIRCHDLMQDLNYAIGRVKVLQDAPSISIADLEQAATEIDNIRDQQYALIAAATAWKYSPADVNGWYEYAIESGAVHPRIDRPLLDDLHHGRKVPTAPFRRWLERSHYTEGAAMELMEAATGREGRELRRTLGLGVKQTTGGHKTLALYADYDLVVKCGETLGAHPYEIGV